MIVSNALPIQFWSVDEETYNEKEVCGIGDGCYCQPIQCDDTVKVQVMAEGSENVELFSPALLDEDGQVVYDPHGFGSAGIHSFIPSAYDICDGKFQMVIYDTQEIDEILPANQWLNTGIHTAYSSKTATQLIVASSLAATTYGAYQSVNIPFSDPDNDIYPMPINVVLDISGSGGGGWSIQSVYSLGLGTIPILSSQVDGEGDGTFNLTLTPEYTENTPLGTLTVLLMLVSISSGGASITITLDSGADLYIQNGIIYKSDCLDIRTEHPCTELISYSNYKNVFNLNYENQSPAPVFQIRLPIVFFHEQFPMEQEVHKLSNDSRMRLWNEMSRKRKLEIGFVPYYIHQKINLILMHDNVEIDGNYWDKEDPYEIAEGNTRYPLKRANVLLTDRDFNKRNLI